MKFIKRPENSFLVTGLESSCTRYVSVLLASNLGLIPVGGWDGHDELGDENFLVTHRSLPHGSRDAFISEPYWSSFKTVVLCTRDLNCSLESKMNWHQRDRDKAEKEQEVGRMVMAEILSKHSNVEVYSYESSFLLGRVYNEVFMSKLGLRYVSHSETKEINSKYFKI